MRNLVIAGIVTLTAIAAFSISPVAFAETSPVQVKVNGQAVVFPDAQPFIDPNGRIEVPVRFVSESMKYKVDWSAIKNSVQVKLSKSNQEIVLVTGHNQATVNGVAVNLDTQPAIVKGRTFVPLRFIAENFGSKVNWDTNTHTADILIDVPAELRYTTQDSINTQPSINSQSAAKLDQKNSVNPILLNTAAAPQNITVPQGYQDIYTPAANKVISTAKSLLGAPYVWGGTNPAGFDCSGFIQYVFAKNSIPLPRISNDMFKMGTSIVEPQPGDLVFFDTDGPGPSHVAMYIGGGNFITTTDSKGVKIQSLSSPYWSRCYIGARHILK